MGLYELSMYPDGYNIYAGGGSPENRATFEKSLDKFIAANPKVGDIDTKIFRDFMIALANHESSFRSKATNNVGNYSGYYGLLNGSKMTEEEQHRAAYNHLKKIFTENMVKEDIVKASELGITPAQLLIKYWNQGNRVTNYLYNGKDSTDGLGTKVSEYGNDINLDLDYSAYLPSAITSDFVTVEKGKNSLSNAIKLARIPGMDYSNRESYIANLNKEYNKGFDSRKLQVGDMIWLVPKSDSEKQDAGNTPTRGNQVHFLEAPLGEYQVSPYNMPAFKNPYIPIQSVDLNTKEGFYNPILQYRANTNATGGPLTKYDTKLPKGKEKEYSQWVKSLPLNLRDDHDYDLRGAFLEGLKPDKYGHMSDKYKKPWHPTFSNESIYSTKDIQGGHWEGDEFIPSPWQEKRQQLINSMNLMEPNTFSNGGTIHIKPENKGKFTAAAKRAGKSVQGYASQILANPDNYSSTLVKRANFARNAAKWHACGGKLYPDGGPIDPPWASFVPSQPREPQVVRPQQQANPYLLGLSAGMGQNEAAKYSTAAQTPEFQQGYYDGQAQVAASEAAKAGRIPVIEPGIEMVSPGLDLSPVGDVKALVDAGEYYQATGDLKTALGLAALGVIAVPGAGKAAERAGREFLDDVTSKEVQQFVKNREMLSGALESMKNYGKQNVPKPIGTLNYSIPSPEPMLSEVPYRLTITPPKPNPMRSLPEPRTFINPDGTVITPGGAVFTPTVEYPINRLSAVEKQKLIKSIGDIDFNPKTEPKVNPTTTTTSSAPSTTQDIGNSKKGLKKVSQWMKDNPWKTSAIFAIPSFLGTIPFWDDIRNKRELSNQRRENPGIVINPGDTVYQNTNTNTASDIDTTTDKYAANRALVENMAALDHDEIEWGRRQLDSVLNTKHSPMDSLIWENWIRQAIEDSATRQNNYRR